MDSVGKKRIPDYTDIAYREAVSRLRYLLADSYTSPHRASFRGLSYTSGARTAGEESGGEDTDAVIERTRALLSPYRRPLYTPARRSLYGTTSRSPIRPMAPSVQVDTPQESHTAPATPRAGTTTHGTENSGQLPPEMMAYIERQEEYIDQLERESHFCREELTSLLGKVKEVISENEGLQEKQKTGVLKSVFDYLHSDNEEGEEEDEDTETSEIEPRKKKRERRQRLEGPNIVFESRISELEAQLTQVRIDLKKAQDEADVYKRRLAGEGLLSDISGVEPESLRHQMEALKREKDELAETVSKLQHTVAQLREREADTTHRLKRSQEAVEQAQFEKSQGELEIRRLKDELDRLHGKLREAVAEQGRRAAEERAGVERRFQQQIEQLQADLTAQWDSTGRLQLDIEKQRRIEAELRREIANKNATLDEMAKETQAKIDMLQGKLSDAVSQHTSLGQELATAEAQADRAEREGRQESKRLGAEVAALRERLDRADSETLRARQEALRLSEQLAALDREMTLRKTKEEIPPTLREQELTSMIKNMEEKHVDTVAELEGMIQSQNQVMAKLKDECHILTERLEDTSARHKQERQSLREENCELRAAIESLSAEYEALRASLQLDSSPHQQRWRVPHMDKMQGANLEWGLGTTVIPVSQSLPPDHMSPHSNPALTCSLQNQGMTHTLVRGGAMILQSQQNSTHLLQREEEIMKLVKESENLNLQKERMHINQREWIAQQWRKSDNQLPTDQETMIQDPLTNSLNKLIQEISLNYPQVEMSQVMNQKEWKPHQQVHYEPWMTPSKEVMNHQEVGINSLLRNQSQGQTMDPLSINNPAGSTSLQKDQLLCMIPPLQSEPMIEQQFRDLQVEQLPTKHQSKKLPEQQVTNHQSKRLHQEPPVISPQYRNHQAEQLLTNHQSKKHQGQQITNLQSKSHQTEHQPISPLYRSHPAESQAISHQFKDHQVEQQAISHQYKSLLAECQTINHQYKNLQAELQVTINPQPKSQQSEHPVTNHQFKNPLIEHTNKNQITNPQCMNPQVDQPVISSQYKSPLVELTKVQHKNLVTNPKYKNLQVDNQAISPQSKKHQIELPVTNPQSKSLQAEHIKLPHKILPVEQPVINQQPRNLQPELPQLQHLMYNNPQREEDMMLPQRDPQQREQDPHQQAVDQAEALSTPQLEQDLVQVSNEEMKLLQENNHDLVARGIHQGEEWSSKVDINCRGPPLTLQDLAS